MVELVGNDPSFELGVYYPAMDPDKWWVKGQLRSIRREVRDTLTDVSSAERRERCREELDRRLEAFWDTIVEVTGVDVDRIQSRRDRIVRLIRRRIDHLCKVKGDLDELEYPLAEQRIYHPILMALDEDTALNLRMELADQPWAQVRPGTQRVYRRGRTLCHILGRTYRMPGAVPKTFEPMDDEDYLPGEIRGRSFLEKQFDDRLKGKRGWLVELPDQPRIRTEPIDGEDVTLTIDIALQEYAENRLQEQIDTLDYATGGAAVVLDLRDQSILALASAPTFDPATLGRNYTELVEDYIHLPLLNRALMGQYPPGSIVKPTVAAIAMGTQSCSPNMRWFCQGYLFRKLKAFRCWRSSGHGDMDFVEGISQSCDVFFYKVGERIGAQELTQYYRSFGFGDIVAGLPLAQGAGLVPDQAWSISHVGRGLSVGDARNLAIGQGALLVTPLQAAVMHATLLEGELRPVKLAESQSIGRSQPLPFPRRSFGLILRGMERGVNDPHGTGYNYARSDELIAAGKSGSAQTPGRSIRWRITYTDTSGRQHTIETDDKAGVLKRIRGQGVKNEDISWRTIGWFPVISEEDRNRRLDRPGELAHGWFLGHVPADNPRVVILVFIEYGMSGGRAAGPVFKDLAEQCKALGYF